MNKAALATWFCIAVIIGGGVYCLFALCQLTCLAALISGMAFLVVMGVGGMCCAAGSADEGMGLK